MRITMVKKIKEDGSACRKCAEVEQRLKDAGLWGRIDQVMIADERDADSEGMKLARRHAVEAAPFFIVEEDGHPARVYTIYLRLLREVLERPATETEESAEILDRHPDLDLL